MLPVFFSDDFSQSLGRTINIFEAYLFATTESKINQHVDFENCKMYLVDGNRSVQAYPMQDIPLRKQVLKDFNKLLSGAEENNCVNGKHLSCILVELDDETERWNETDVQESVDAVSSVAINWMQENNRIGIIVQHLHQKDRVPHLHILHQRAPRKYNELRTFLQNL